MQVNLLTYVKSLELGVTVSVPMEVFIVIIQIHTTTLARVSLIVLINNESLLWALRCARNWDGYLVKLKGSIISRNVRFWVDRKDSARYHYIWNSDFHWI